MWQIIMQMDHILNEFSSYYLEDQIVLYTMSYTYSLKDMLSSLHNLMLLQIWKYELFFAFDIDSIRILSISQG